MNLLPARVKAKVINKLRGGSHAARAIGVSVGSDCRILSLEFGSEPWLVSIGNRVTLSSGVQILTHDGVGWLYVDASGRRYSYGKVKIGSDVFVGNRAIVMPGVSIGDRCVVGAGSVVTKSIPDGTVVAGNPARVVGTFAELMSRVAEWPADSMVRNMTLHERSSFISGRSTSRPFLKR